MENENRSLAELYKILYDTWLSRLYFTPFVCLSIEYLLKQNLISKEEEFLLRKDFEVNKPSSTKHEEFYNNHYFIGGGAWWHDNTESNLQRKAFLEKMINLNS